MAPATHPHPTIERNPLGKEATMATNFATHAKGERITVDLSKTIGQESAIAANGSPVFEIAVTWSLEILPPAHDGTYQESAGFGRVVSGGPVNGYEVLYTGASVQ